MKKVVITAEGCGYCEQYKKEHESEIVKGEMVVKRAEDLDANSDVWKLTTQFGLRHVPLIIRVEEKDNGKKVCVQDHLGKDHCTLLPEFDP